MAKAKKTVKKKSVKKESFFSKLFKKMDKAMQAKAKKSDCCCSGKDCK